MRCRATMSYARVGPPPRVARRFGYRGGVAVARDANAGRTSISKGVSVGANRTRSLFPSVTAPASARLSRGG
jgi:hypothetical protein